MASEVGSKVFDVYLFGSYARGDYDQESDIDLLLVVEGKLNPAESDVLRELALDWMLEYSKLVSILEVTREEFERGSSPLIEVVKREGISLL